MTSKINEAQNALPNKIIKGSLSITLLQTAGCLRSLLTSKPLSSFCDSLRAWPAGLPSTGNKCGLTGSLPFTDLWEEQKQLCLFPCGRALQRPSQRRVLASSVACCPRMAQGTWALGLKYGIMANTVQFLPFQSCCKDWLDTRWVCRFLRF